MSNGTDVMSVIGNGALGVAVDSDAWHAQLVPTLLFKNETSQEGEIFRIIIVNERDESAEEKVWDDFCITVDLGGSI